MIGMFVPTKIHVEFYHCDVFWSHKVQIKVYISGVCLLFCPLLSHLLFLLFLPSTCDAAARRCRYVNVEFHNLETENKASLFIVNYPVSSILLQHQTRIEADVFGFLVSPNNRTAEASLFLLTDSSTEGKMSTLSFYVPSLMSGQGCLEQRDQYSKSWQLPLLIAVAKHPIQTLKQGKVCLGSQF